MPHKDYTSLSDYSALLINNRLFLLLWIGETANQFGTWFSYVACFKLVQDLTGEVGIALSIVLVVRNAPRLVWFLIAGGVADAFNRAWVLIASCLLQAAVLLLFPLVPATRSLGLLYALVFLQFTFNTLYDPAKSALIPNIVGADQLHIAAVLDSFAFSLMAAIGSSLGGFVVAYYGSSVCFLIDAATFLVAAACASKLINIAGSKSNPYRPVPDTEAGPQDVDGPTDQDTTLAGLVDSDLDVAKPVAMSHLLVEDGPPRGPRGIRSILARGVESIARGLVYMAARANRDVAVLALLKASGGFVWAPADILNAELSNMKTLQLHQGSSATLGLLFGAVGVGCILGPLLSNALVPATPAGWLCAAAGAHLLLVLGYAALLPPPHLLTAMAATVLRASGSNILWIYSTTILQQRVDNASQGSVFAAEMAAYTLSSSSASLATGAVFQNHSLGAQGLAAVMASIGTCLLVLWALYAWRRSRGRQRKPLVTSFHAASLELR